MKLYLLSGVPYRYCHQTRRLIKVAGYDFNRPPQSHPYDPAGIAQHYQDRGINADPNAYGSHPELPFFDDSGTEIGAYRHPAVSQSRSGLASEVGPGENHLAPYQANDHRVHKLRFEPTANSDHHQAIIQATGERMFPGELLHVEHPTGHQYFQKQESGLKSYLPRPGEAKQADIGRQIYQTRKQAYGRYQDTRYETDLIGADRYAPSKAPEAFAAQDQAISLEDRYLQRQQNKQSWQRQPSGAINDYRQRGQAWVKERGLDPATDPEDETSYHDGRHQLVHEMLGTDSEGLGRFLHGDDWQNLNGEEDVVQFLEAMGEGQSFNQAKNTVLNQRRQLNPNRVIESQYVDRFNHLAEQIYKHPQFKQYMDAMRTH